MAIKNPAADFFNLQFKYSGLMKLLRHVYVLNGYGFAWVWGLTESGTVRALHECPCPGVWTWGTWYRVT